MTFISHAAYCNNKIITITINGPLDRSTSSDFEKNIDTLLDQNNNYIILNASELSFVSSEGIGAIIYAAKQISSKKGELIIAAPSFELSSLFHLLRFDRSIITAPSINKSIEILHSKYLSTEPLNYTKNDYVIENKNEILQDENISYTKQTDVKETISRQDQSSKKASTEMSIHFTKPIVVECNECGSFIRIHKSGNYLCPSCHTEIYVKNDGTIVF